MKSKIFILLTLCGLACAPAFAQVRTDINLRDKNNSSFDIDEDGFNAHSYALGVGLGSTKMYGDLPKSNPQPAYIGYLAKNITPSILLESQLTIGDLSSNDPNPKFHIRSFNHFTAAEEHIIVELGTLFYAIRKDYQHNLLMHIASGFYGSIGLGIINNDVKRISYVNQDELVGAMPSSAPIYLQNSMAMYIPLSVGYNLHLRRFLIFKSCMFNANFQYNDCQSDYVDGYKLPFKANKKNDIYTVMSIGFKFYLNHANSTGE